MMRNPRHFDDQVDAVQQWPGDFFQIALHFLRGAAAAALRIAVVAAMAEKRCLFAICTDSA